MDKIKGDFISKFRVYECNITKACRGCGIKRRDLKKWVETDPEFAEEYDNCLEELSDWAEESIREKIKTGKGMDAVVANIFYLKALAPNKFNEKIVQNIKHEFSLKDLMTNGNTIKIGKSKAEEVKSDALGDNTGGYLSGTETNTN